MAVKRGRDNSPYHTVDYKKSEIIADFNIRVLLSNPPMTVPEKKAAWDTFVSECAELSRSQISRWSCYPNCVLKDG